MAMTRTIKPVAAAAMRQPITKASVGNIAAVIAPPTGMAVVTTFIVKPRNRPGNQSMIALVVAGYIGDETTPISAARTSTTGKACANGKANVKAVTLRREITSTRFILKKSASQPANRDVAKMPAAYVDVIRPTWARDKPKSI